jgi:hypothetical protein
MMAEKPERLGMLLTAPEWLVIVDALTFLGVWTGNQAASADEFEAGPLEAMSDEAKRLSVRVRYDDPFLRAFLDEHEEAVSRE